MFRLELVNIKLVFLLCSTTKKNKEQSQSKSAILKKMTVICKLHSWRYSFFKNERDGGEEREMYGNNDVLTIIGWSRENRTFSQIEISKKKYHSK